MTAKERLRQFLEQRRELGETEFVLDGMSVDDALRVLGASETQAPEPVGSRETQPGGRGPRSGPGSRGPDTLSGGVRGPASSPTDWREALKAVGAEARPEQETRRAGESARGEAQRPGAPPRFQDTADRSGPSHHSVPDRTNPLHSSPVTAPPGVPSGDPDREPPPLQTLPLDQIPTGIVIGSPTHELFDGSRSPWSTLDDIARAVAGCTLCPLAATARNPVPGHGNPNADFVCVGEAPGASEDEQGVPFVGQAGQLLTRILAAINLSREDVFICNVLKHRPPGNRNPLPDEVAACSPYLVRQIELLRPKVILALGTFAAQTLLQTKESIGKLRGRIHRYHGVPLIVTYHPAALLRNPSWKRPTWEDVQLARKLLDRTAGD